MLFQTAEYGNLAQFLPILQVFKAKLLTFIFLLHRSKHNIQIQTMQNMFLHELEQGNEGGTMKLLGGC